MNWKWWESDSEKQVNRRLNGLEIAVGLLTRKVKVQEGFMEAVKQELQAMEGQVAALSGVVTNIRGDVGFLTSEVARLEEVIAGGTVTVADLQPLKDRIAALGLQLAEVDAQTPEQSKPPTEETPV